MWRWLSNEKENDEVNEKILFAEELVQAGVAGGAKETTTKSGEE